jgi:uracil-DNA glycosylase
MNSKLKSIIHDLSTQNFTDSFNPYRDLCEYFDVPESCKVRKKNLENYFEYFSKFDAVDLWIGRDLGYKGGRRTGIPFTSENNISNLNSKLGLNLKIESNSKVISSEVSANTIWEIFNNLSNNIIFWNIYPYHPHEKGNQLSNRKFNREEEAFGLKILEALIHTLNIKRIICIGNDSYKSLKKIKIENILIISVRHPSYGGVNTFKEQISKIYNIKNSHQSDLFND